MGRVAPALVYGNVMNAALIIKKTPVMFVELKTLIKAINLK